MSADASTRMNLNLEKSASKSKRQLSLYSNKHLLAIGGSNGTITALNLNSKSDDAEAAFRTIKQFDDAVRALAFSSDGQRVAVGYDDGQVRIFSYSKEELNDGNDIDCHPFVTIAKQNSVNIADSQSDDEGFFDEMLSQNPLNDDKAMEGPSSSESTSSSFFLPRRFDSEVRSLSFQPNTYHLAIALESSPGFLIADVASQSSEKYYLEQESIAQYQQAGVRNLCFSPSGNTLATLGCDGRLCLWNTTFSSDSDPELDWELYHADTFNAAEIDSGAFSDVFEKATMCAFSSNEQMLVMGGSKDLQIRRKGDEADREWMKKDKLVLAPKNETTGEIVAIAFDPLNEGYIVTSFRNGKIGIWKLKTNAMVCLLQ